MERYSATIRENELSSPQYQIVFRLIKKSRLHRYDSYKGQRLVGKVLFMLISIEGTPEDVGERPAVSDHRHFTKRFHNDRHYYPRLYKNTDLTCFIVVLFEVYYTLFTSLFIEN